MLIGFYIDDLLVTFNNAKLNDDVLEEMKAFDVKFLGVVTKFLGIKVARGYNLSQQVRILNLTETLHEILQNREYTNREGLSVS
jgi:hypothetical protein